MGPIDREQLEQVRGGFFGALLGMLPSLLSGGGSFLSGGGALLGGIAQLRASRQQSSQQQYADASQYQQAAAMQAAPAQQAGPPAQSYDDGPQISVVVRTGAGAMTA
jgi:hypothetical protein